MPRKLRPELAFFKAPRKKPRNAVRERFEGGVRIRYPKENETMLIHTHGLTEFSALPSLNDLEALVRFAAQGTKVRTLVIVSLDSENRETGKTFVKISRKADRITLNHMLERISEMQANLLVKNAKEYYEALKLLKRYGLIIKFLPAKGYKFDENSMRFVCE